MQLIQDWKEFIELLISRQVRFLMVGGWAVNTYVTPRMTGDIDFFKRSRRMLKRYTMLRLQRALYLVLLALFKKMLMNGSFVPLKKFIQSCTSMALDLTFVQRTIKSLKSASILC